MEKPNLYKIWAALDKANERALILDDDDRSELVEIDELRESLLDIVNWLIEKQKEDK